MSRININIGLLTRVRTVPPCIEEPVFWFELDILVWMLECLATCCKQPVRVVAPGAAMFLVLFAPYHLMNRLHAGLDRRVHPDPTFCTSNSVTLIRNTCVVEEPAGVMIGDV